MLSIKFFDLNKIIMKSNFTKDVLVMNKGIILALAAALSLAVMGAFVKAIGHSLPDSTILFSRFLISLILVIPIVFRDRSHFSLRINKKYILLIRCSVGLMAMAAYFYAIRFTHLVNVILLINTSPVFVPILIFIFLRKKTSKKVLAGIIISFIGIILVLNPNRSSLLNPYNLLALSGGIMMGAGILSLKLFLKHNNNRTTEVLLLYFIFSTVISGIWMMFDWKTPNFEQLLLLLGSGVFGSLFQILMTYSLKYISATLTSCLTFFSIIFAGILSWGIWGEAPSNLTLLGIMITVMGAFAVIRYSRDINSTNQQTILSVFTLKNLNMYKSVLWMLDKTRAIVKYYID